jgi:RHS repeat-associated protein
LDYTSPLKDVILESESGEVSLTYRYTYGLEKVSTVISGFKKGAGDITQYVSSGNNGEIKLTTKKPSKGGFANGIVKLYSHHDRLGSTDYLTDNVAGKAASFVSYDDWGIPTKKTAFKLDSRELDLVTEYTGHPYDRVLNLYFAEARMYDAADRRFMAEDLIKEDPAQYTYVSNNPIRYFDPLGLLKVSYGNNDIESSFDYETGTLSIDVKSTLTALNKHNDLFSYTFLSENYKKYGGGHSKVSLQYKSKSRHAETYFWENHTYSYVYNGMTSYSGWDTPLSAQYKYIGGGKYSGTQLKPSVSYEYFNKIICELTDSDVKGPTVMIEDLDEAFLIMHKYLDGRIPDGPFVNLAIEYAAANGNQKSVKNFVTGDFEGNKNAVVFDDDILAWTNFWNDKINSPAMSGIYTYSTTIRADVVKAMIAQESSLGKLSRLNGTRNVMQSLVTGDHSLWIGAAIDPLEPV